MAPLFYLERNPELGAMVVLEGTYIKRRVRVQSYLGGLIWHVFPGALAARDGSKFKPRREHLKLLAELQRQRAE